MTIPWLKSKSRRLKNHTSIRLSRCAAGKKKNKTVKNGTKNKLKMRIREHTLPWIYQFGTSWSCSVVLTRPLTLTKTWVRSSRRKPTRASTFLWWCGLRKLQTSSRPRGWWELTTCPPTTTSRTIRKSGALWPLVNTKTSRNWPTSSTTSSVLGLTPTIRSAHLLNFILLTFLK